MPLGVVLRPAQIRFRDVDDKQDITQFMFLALPRNDINDELGSWPKAIAVFDGETGSKPG